VLRTYETGMLCHRPFERPTPLGTMRGVLLLVLRTTRYNEGPSSKRGLKGDSMEHMMPRGVASRPVVGLTIPDIIQRLTIRDHKNILRHLLSRVK